MGERYDVNKAVKSSGSSSGGGRGGLSLVG